MQGHRQLGAGYERVLFNDFPRVDLRSSQPTVCVTQAFAYILAITHKTIMPTMTELVIMIAFASEGGSTKLEIIPSGGGRAGIWDRSNPGGIIDASMTVQIAVK